MIIYSGKNFTWELAKALGITRPVKSITLHSPCDGSVTVSVEYALEHADGVNLVNRLKSQEFLLLPVENKPSVSL